MEDIDSKFITVKGSNIRYIVRGSGAPVLLIHGFGEFLETWWFNIEPLSEYDARLEVIPECGHCPHIEKPREFNGAAIAFLESNGRDENVR